MNECLRPTRGCHKHSLAFRIVSKRSWDNDTLPQGDAKVTAVGRDGDWLLIVSKKGNAPGFIEMAAVQGGGSERRDATRVAAEGKYQTISDTQVRSGPGLHYPVVADLTKGTKITVVDNESGWLRVESKRGNKPGYVDASFARPTEEP